MFEIMTGISQYLDEKNYAMLLAPEKWRMLNEARCMPVPGFDPRTGGS